MKRIKCKLYFLRFFFITSSIILQAQVPQLINYQGRLTENDVPLNSMVSITFTIYDALTSGTNLWSEIQTNVTVDNGIFNVLLGSVNPFPSNLFTNSGNRYLGIKVGSQELSPRSQITSVAYSIQSEQSVTTSQIQGKPISSDAPDSNQVLKWDGALWKPGVDNTSTGGAVGISSLDGVKNDGGNIDLIQGSNVMIESDDAANTITISSSGGTGGGDITRVTAGNGLTGGGETADVTLNVGGGNGISVSADTVALNTTYTDGRYVNVGEENSISKNMITPNILTGLNSITSDGGNINLEGSGIISISSDDATDKITISATGGTTGDNLGNHTATQNIHLNNHYLSGDGGNEGIYVNNSGNIGIGVDTSDLRYKIELGKTIELNNYLRLHSKNWGGLLFNDGSAMSKTYVGGISYGYSTNSLHFDTQGDDGDPSTKMVVSKDGVHIFDKGEKSGEVIENIDGLIVENSGSNNSYYVFQTATVGGGKSFSITNAGNIGIGTTNPMAELDVVGQIRTSVRGDGSAGGLTLSGNNLGNEGGQIDWNGGGSYDDWVQDSYQNEMRFFTNSTNNNKLSIFNAGGGSANLIIEGEINNWETGQSANLLPIAYAFINSNGSIMTGTSNVSSEWNITFQRYEITITGHSYFWTNYVTIVTPTSPSVMAQTGSISGKLTVNFNDTSGNKVQTHFQFISYKP